MTELFIEKATKIHGDKYDYSKTEYKKAKEKVIIICKMHGEFLLTPDKHLSRKSGCKKCGVETRSNEFKSNTQDFIEKANKLHENKFDYSKTDYKNSKEKVIIICKIHGEFLQIPSKHLIGRGGCITCKNENSGSTQRLTNEDFIEKSIKIHGDKFDYSKTDYKNSTENVIIICKIHGEFLKIPSCHLIGSGCSKCSGHYKSNTMEFIEKSMKIHGGKFDYSKTDYIKSNENVIIICKIHGEFLQMPSGHLSGAGCSKCSGYYKSNTIEFIEKAKKIYGDKFDYSKTEYKKAIEKVIIICKTHGEFLLTPDSHLHGTECWVCGGNYKSNTMEFIEKSKKIHGDKFDYSKTEYKRAREKVIIICKTHGQFLQTADSHLHGIGCRKCYGFYDSTTPEFIERAIKIHGDKFDYSKTDYTNITEKVIIICKTHGEFLQTPSSHLIGSGCCKCNPKYSKPQIQWLNFIQSKYNIIIKHALNDGEFKIPTTRYKADGYCEETNTIYEFHGDLWHGNPIMYNQEDISFFGKKYGELYQNTLEREQQISDLGYNLVIMWEHDWNKINKSIRVLQRKFKSLH